MEVVGRLASGIAHDFNNLLTVINGTADLALTDLKEGDPLRTDLQDIAQAGESAASLTRQLLAFSRQQIMTPDFLNLSTLVADMQDMLRRLIGEDIALVVGSAKDVGSIMADPVQIKQVVMNLAVNARDAMPNGGTLTIETRDVALDEAFAAEHPSVKPGPHVMLAISDTGEGMDEATRGQIFEPFFTTKELGKGTGLGLATVYGIVSQSGGSISAHSELGKGTTFRIYLPLVEAVARNSQSTPAVTSVEATETVLIVEDEAAVCRLAKRVLEVAGYRVLTASNGFEALTLLEQHDGPVHLMLTDMVMPGMSGRDLAIQLDATHPQTKVLYTSGYTDDAILHNRLPHAAADFIGKPYTIAELTRKVREVLDS
jgi:CheY-like chemotaxis protein